MATLSAPRSLGGSLPTRSPSAGLDRTLMALADPTRRGVIELLRQEPRKASDLADALALTRPAMSRHLRVLRKTGLVTESEPEHDARVRVYRLEREPFAELRGWLQEVEGFWADQLSAFKAHAERPQGRSSVPERAAVRRGRERT